MDKDKIVSDAIFGFITLKPYVTAIIDTPEFQRLRCIWQLGVTPFVYHTADHSRFEHSIGTYWLASKLIKKIKQQFEGMTDEERDGMIIDENDVMCVEIAALCHDIGHGPFSHFWDNKVLPKFNNGYYVCHEEQFRKMWEILKRNKKVNLMIKNYKLNEDNEQLIEAIIIGKEIPGKEILCSIVNNKESGMDVDKWDYLARDATYLGHASTNYRADIERMIHLSRAIQDKDGKWKIGYRNTESLNILRVFQLRHYMHQTAYRHRASLVIEQMMLDGIGRCIENGIILRAEIGSAEWLLKNTDALFWSNFSDILEFKLILERDLYKPLFEAVKYEITSDPSDEIIEYLTNNHINTDSLRVVFYQFTLGNYDSNPIFSVPFYKKCDGKLFYFSPKSLPSKLDLDCNESKVLVLSTNTLEDQEDSAAKIKCILVKYFVKEEWIIGDLDRSTTVA